MYTYSSAEYTDMHLMYGLADGNAVEARRLYQERFPNRRLPNNRTFVSVDRHLRESGSFGRQTGQGRPVAHSPDEEDVILDIIHDEPQTSTRRISSMVDIPHSSVWRILHRQLLHPYHLQLVQALNPTDYPHRQRFCQWIQRRHAADPSCLSQILFTDEATFTRTGIVNSHNQHHWADANPHVTRARAHQERFSVNIWCGIFGNNLIGPYVLPPRLTGRTYLLFLQNTLPELLEDVPLLIRSNMWFMHDGTPAHFSHVVRAHLNGAYTNRWIGRGGPVAWPARSPDLNPLDFFLWGHVKTIVYSTEVPNIMDLRQRIENACQTVRNAGDELFHDIRRSLMQRAEACVRAGGGHFEQFL